LLSSLCEREELELNPNNSGFTFCIFVFFFDGVGFISVLAVGLGEIVGVCCNKACAYCFVGVCFDTCFLEALFRDGKSLSDVVVLFVFESSSGTSQKSDDSSFTGATFGIIFCPLSSA